MNEYPRPGEVPPLPPIGSNLPQPELQPGYNTERAARIGTPPGQELQPDTSQSDQMPRQIATGPEDQETPVSANHEQPAPDQSTIPEPVEDTSPSAPPEAPAPLQYKTVVSEATGSAAVRSELSENKQPTIPGRDEPKIQQPEAPEPATRSKQSGEPPARDELTQELDMEGTSQGDSDPADGQPQERVEAERPDPLADPREQSPDAAHEERRLPLRSLAELSVEDEELTTAQVMEAVKKFTETAKLMTSPEIDDPSPENLARAAQQVLRLNNLMRELAREEGEHGLAGPRRLFGNAWTRTMSIPGWDNAPAKKHTSAEVGLEDYSSEEAPPSIINRDGRSINSTILTHVDLSDTLGARCWGVAVQGDLPELLLFRNVTPHDFSSPIKEERSPLIVESRGNGQQAAELTRLLTLVRRSAVPQGSPPPPKPR